MWVGNLSASMFMSPGLAMNCTEIIEQSGMRTAFVVIFVYEIYLQAPKWVQKMLEHPFLVEFFFRSRLGHWYNQR